MSKLTITAAGMALLLVLFPACEKELLQDDSLIIVKSGSDRYSIISPSSGSVLQDVQPDIPPVQFARAYLGFQSEKVILLAKEPEGSHVQVIYTCDRETGGNVTAITTKDQWHIQSVCASWSAPRLVFHGHPADGGESQSNLFSVNMDGSNLQQLTQNRELIDGIELWWPGEPSWSPDGLQIAFRGTMRTPDPGAVWWGKAIIIMDANGANKQILYNEPDPNSGEHYDLAWTREGSFLIFLTNEGTSTPSRRVKVLHTLSGDITDITDRLLVDGKSTTNICTSPEKDQLLFNKYEPGGGDLHEIDYVITEDGEFQVSGTARVKCRISNGKHFGAPRWQWFTED